MINKLVNNDCIAEMATMENNSVYCTITDFPYMECSGFVEGGLRKINRDAADMDADGGVFNTIKATEEICRITKGSVLIFCGMKQIKEIREVFEKNNMQMIRLIIWEKPNVSPMNGQYGFLNSIEQAVFARKPNAYWGGHCEHNVFVHPTQPLDWHPTAKPIGLLKQFVEFMCPVGETVFDPTAGSFSTAVAANEMNRGYYCIEKNPEFYEKAKQYYDTRLRQQCLF